MQAISVFLDITKFVDVSRTQEVCHVIYISFGSSLGKVQLLQVSSL